MNLPKNKLTNEKIDEILKYLVDNAETFKSNCKYIVDQALKEIEKDYISKEKVLQLIDEASPKKFDLEMINNNLLQGKPQAAANKAGYNYAIIQYQSNLKEALK